MNDTPDPTSPEAVERLDPETHADKFDPSTGGYVVTFEKYAAVSAELSGLKDAYTGAMEDKRMWKRRAEAADAELTTLKAELADAVEMIEKAYREGWSDGAADEIHEYCSNPHDDWLVSDTRRADLCAKSEAISPTQDERVKALVEALVEAVKAMPQDWYDDNCDCGGL